MAGVLADVVVVVHLAALVFLVLGGFLAFRWPKVFPAHVVMVVWGVAIVGFDLLCPLTSVENSLRGLAGRPELDGGFIDTYLTGVIYPGDRITEVRSAVAVVVALSWAGLLLRWRVRRPASAGNGAHGR